MKNLITTALLASSAIVSAQSIEDFINPATGIIDDHRLVLESMEEQYPGYKQVVNETFDKCHQFSTKSGQEYTVNVVFHVVYNEEEENLPDSVIYSQLDVLNEDFGRMNADSVNLRPIFQPIAGNPAVHFNLAGIVRVPTTASFTVGFNGLPDEVKQSSQGGSDAWDTQYFMNVWICKLDNPFGALFGYAYPPAGLSNWPANSNAPSPELDGVVLDYRTVGRNNPNPYPNPQGGGNFVFTGRTGTHEVGHYMGLRHIWGDGGGLFGGESCGEDDGIADTPNQGYQSDFNCDPTLNTCTDSTGGAPDPNDMPDLIENHMDYSDETCKNMFTLGQAMHIRGVLENERIDLINAPASIEESTKSVLNLYPNPNNGTFLINSNVSGILSVFDLQGRMVHSQKINNGLSNGEIANVSSGTYIVKLNSENGESITDKLIIK